MRRGAYEKKPIKIGARRTGTLCTFPDGRAFYLAQRRLKHILRSGERIISDALRKDTAYWVVEDQILRDMRRNGVMFAGVEVIETGDVYMARMSDWFDPRLSKTLNKTRASFRMLGLHNMTLKLGFRKL